VKYRKKPVVIEAVEFKPNPTDADVNELMASTLEGEHLASPGDFIIKGVKGEYYPCKPDIFAATYDAVPMGGQAGDPLQ
jgi:hypothetical protein